MEPPAPTLSPTLTSFFKGKRVLITGGRGYIATRILRLLQPLPCRITRLVRSHADTDRSPDALSRATMSDLPGDVRDRSIWAPALQNIDIVFHLAAQTSTYAANDDPESDHKANVAPMLHLLEACRQGGLHPAIVFSGTVTAVGIPQRLPVDETHADHPITVYDLHKRMAESYLAYYSEQGVARGVTLRLSNVYGPGPISSRPDRGILNAMIRRALKGEALTVYGKGEFLRDYVYVDDVAQAFLLAAAAAEKLSGAHFVISTGRGHTLAEAARLVAARAEAKTGRPVEVRNAPPPTPQSPIEARNFIGNPKRFAEATGWSPHHSLAEGIDLTIEAMS